MKTQKITLGTTVATPKGLGIVIGFGKFVGSTKVEIESTLEVKEFFNKELKFLSK
jgi:hypothetical protein